MNDGALLREEATPPAATDGLPMEIRILELFGAGVMVIGPTDVEKAIGISKGLASPRMRRLAEAGYLAAVGGGQYQLGPRAARLYLSYMMCMAARLDQFQASMAMALGPIRDMVIELSNIAPQEGGRQKDEGGSKDPESEALASSSPLPTSAFRLPPSSDEEPQA